MGTRMSDSTKTNIIALVILACGGCASHLDRSTAERWAFSPTLPEDGAPVAARTVDQSVHFQDPADESLLSALSPTKLRRSAQAAIGRGPNVNVAKKLYIDAEQKFREASGLQGRQAARAYLSAAKTYSAAADRWPESALEEDALLMVAECYFFANEYPEANKAYEILLKKYSRTRHLDAAEARRFKIAEYWLDLGKKENMLAINLTNGHKPWRRFAGCGHSRAGSHPDR